MKPTLKPRTTLFLGPTSREVLSGTAKPSHRLEWVCTVYRATTAAALPRLRQEEWAWLVVALHTLDVRTPEHLALIPDRVRQAGETARGIDHQSLAVRLTSLSMAAKAGVWDLVLDLGHLANDPEVLTRELTTRLPTTAFLR